MNRCLVALLLASALGAPGCHIPQGPYRAQDPEHRDTARAEQLTRRAADLITADPGKAESLLREALSADLFHGPAHNNLGVIYLNQGRLYEAAGEFEWARKLMPGHPDPRLNLGLALERGGRIDEAIDAYHSALETTPEHLPTIESMASCQIRYGRQDSRTTELLSLIAMRGDKRWRAWAQDQAILLQQRQSSDPSR